MYNITKITLYITLITCQQYVWQLNPEINKDLRHFQCPIIPFTNIPQSRHLQCTASPIIRHSVTPYTQAVHTHSQKRIRVEIVFSFVAKLKTCPIDCVHKIACGAPQSLEFPYGDLLFQVFEQTLGTPCFCTVLFFIFFLLLLLLLPRDCPVTKTHFPRPNFTHSQIYTSI